jgi:hypothetical protein
VLFFGATKLHIAQVCFMEGLGGVATLNNTTQRDLLAMPDLSVRRVVHPCHEPHGMQQRVHART